MNLILTTLQILIIIAMTFITAMYGFDSLLMFPLNALCIAVLVTIDRVADAS